MSFDSGNFFGDMIVLPHSTALHSDAIPINE